MVRRHVIALVLLGAVGLSGCRGSSESTTTTRSETTPQTTAAPADTAAAAGSGTSATGGNPMGSTEGALAGTIPVKPEITPAHVEVQHILIAFAGSLPGRGVARTQAVAKTLAYDILARARKGEDFDALVRQYTDDSPPGIYKMANTGVSHAVGEYPREGMVPAFGNVGFEISPGNIAIADYDLQTSPYGWHIIKRLR